MHRFNRYTRSLLLAAAMARGVGNEEIRVKLGLERPIAEQFAIWQAADGQTPLSQIVERRVCDEFEIEPEVARRDAEEFVSQLSQHGILLVSDRPIQDHKLGTAEAR